jgi:hypothetical protein
MRIYIHGLMIILLGCSLVGCNKKLTSNELPANVSLGGTYYTQVVMHYEKNVHPTTNYQVGAMIPVNTPINLLEINEKTIDITVNGGQKITVKNIAKHTGDNTVQAFNKLFNRQKVNLDQFSALEKEHIASGTVAVGMSKKAVTTAIGYPPITQTASLNADTWVFWRHRFNTFKVNFKNGRVSDIVD